MLSRIFKRKVFVDACTDFWEGFSRPSGKSLLIALIVPSLIFGSVILTLDEKWFASDNHRLFADSATDDNTFASGTALQLGFSAVDKEKFIIVGASATRVAIRPDVVQDVLGDAVEVYPMATGRQSFWETAHLLSRIPEGTRGVLTIGVGPSRLTRGVDTLTEIQASPRVAFRDRGFDNSLEEAGLTPAPYRGIYALDNASFLLTRLPALLRNMRSGKPVHDPRYLGRPAATPNQYKNIAKRVSLRWPHYEQNHMLNLETLAEVIRIVREKTNLNVVLVEHTLNPDFVAQYMPEGFLDDYRADMQTFAERHSVPYLMPASDLDYGPEQFFDWAHLRKQEAAQLYTLQLLRSLNSIHNLGDHNE